MRGEFSCVWEDTYRYIWDPLFDQGDVPEDVHSQLFRELWKSLGVPSGDDAQRIPLGDAIQLREGFFRAIEFSGAEIRRELAEEAFLEARATDSDDPADRRIALVKSLSLLLGDSAEATRALAVALSELAADPKRRAEAQGRAVEAIINNTARSREAFGRVRSADFAGERAVVSFLEAAFDVLSDIGSDELSNRYFNLLAAFIDKFSLRYDLRRPCILCPTLPGVFASLVRDLRALTSQDSHLDVLMKDFEDAVRDLRQGCSDGRIKTCISKQVNLLEALGRACPGVTGKTLGVISDQVATWPHHQLKAAIKDVYGFASDYPGIRHGGTPANALRAVDMRDMVALSILLAGFTPYLSHVLDSDVVYRGA